MAPLELVLSTYLLLIINVLVLGPRHPGRARVALVAGSSVLGVDAVAELLSIILPSLAAAWVMPLRLVSVIGNLIAIGIVAY